MPVAFFQVRLSVQPTGGGDAALVLPEVLRDLNYRFFLVKDGGEEGILQLEESEAVLENVGKEEDCIQLSGEEVDTRQKNYPRPKLKQKYRELDAKGSRIVDTIQTVRSGFYLIDVPVLVRPTDHPPDAASVKRSKIISK